MELTDPSRLCWHCAVTCLTLAAMVKKKPPAGIKKTLRIPASQKARVERLVDLIRATQPEENLPENKALLRSLLFVLRGIEDKTFTADQVSRVRTEK